MPKAKAGAAVAVLAILAVAAIVLLVSTRDSGSPQQSQSTTPGGAGAQGATLYVSEDGDDAASGTGSDPLKTLATAVAKADPGTTIVVRAGSYPAAAFGQAARAITVRGEGRPRVEGLVFAGASGVTVRGLAVRGPIAVGAPTAGASRIRLERLDVSARGQNCVTIRNARAVSVVHSRIHGCGAGIAGPANSTPNLPSSHIRIEGNVLERLTGDGVIFGSWRDVTLAHNAIRDIDDPSGRIHNDGVQLMGGNYRTRIVGNRITDSSDQLMFIQDTYAPIEGLDITGNFLSGSGAVAVQAQGAVKLRFTHNAVLRTRFGGLWLRGPRPAVAGRAAGAAATDSVVSDNVLATFRRIEGARTASASGNVLVCGPLQRERCVAASEITSVGTLAGRSSEAGPRSRPGPTRP